MSQLGRRSVLHDPVKVTRLKRGLLAERSCADLAAEWGVTEATISHWRAQLGLQRTPPRRDPAVLAQVRAMREAGKTHDEIAQATGRSREWVSGLVRDGLVPVKRPLPPRGPTPKLFRCRCGAVVTESRAVDVCIHREGAA